MLLAGHVAARLLFSKSNLQAPVVNVHSVSVRFRIWLEHGMFRAQPTVTLHFGGAIHQQQRRVLSAHDARASAFGCFIPWPLPAVMDWQPLGVAVTTCVLQVSGRFSRLRLILQYSCLSAMSACALHRCLPSPDACAIGRPPTSSPICLLVLVLF